MSENTYFLNQQQNCSLDYNRAYNYLGNSSTYTPPAEGWVAPASGVLFLKTYFANGHGTMSGYINGNRIFTIGSDGSSGEISVPVTKGDIVRFRNSGAGASNFGDCSFWWFTFVPYK